MPFNDDLPAEGTDPWYAPLATAWSNLKSFINGLETSLGGKADLVHTHAAGDVTSGTFTVTRIPDLNASKIASGVLDIARIPDISETKVTGLGTAAVADAADFATATQGALADSAVQPDDPRLAIIMTQAAYDALTPVPGQIYIIQG